jgi:hypothetical protein
MNGAYYEDTPFFEKVAFSYGEIKGEANGLQNYLLHIVEKRFPSVRSTL